MTDPSHDFGISPQQPSKKSYAAMKVSKLGDLANLTQQMTSASYSDMRGGRMVMMRRRRIR